MGSDLASAATSALVSATTQLTIQGGKVSWQAVAADTLTGLVYNRAASNALVNAQRSAIGNTTAVSNQAGGSINLNANAADIAFGSTDDYLRNPQQRGGLDVTWTDSPSQQAVKNGGLYVTMEGVPDDVVSNAVKTDIAPSATQQAQGLKPQRQANTPMIDYLSGDNEIKVRLNYLSRNVRMDRQTLPAGAMFDAEGRVVSKPITFADFGKDRLLSDTINSAVVGNPLTGKSSELGAAIKYSLIDTFYPANGYEFFGGLAGGYVLGKVGIPLATKAFPALGKTLGEVTGFGANTVAKQAAANEYYKTLRWDDARIASHTSGIDFSKPVEVVTLPKGTQVVQYQIPGNPVDGYFAPIGTTAESLGISSIGRNPIIYTTTEDISVLRSTAANTSKNLSIPESARGAGGGTQFFTNNRNVFQPLGQ